MGLESACRAHRESIQKTEPALHCNYKNFDRKGRRKIGLKLEGWEEISSFKFNTEDS
jgi:hypothetical protein